MNSLEQAVEILKKNGIIIFPTETTYGIGCRLGSEVAIKRLYQIKKREADKPTSIVVENLEQAKIYAQLSYQAEKLAQHFWPGPLTLVLPATSRVPDLIKKEGTIGLRQPSHSVLLALLKNLGEPLLAPSANFAGQPAPNELNSVDSRLVAMVDYVVDAPTGGQKPSTVLELSDDKMTFLREGPISLIEIKRVLGASVG
jgi:L-threonylcarbamoyladenylate synthase